ncbi:RhuM family protein [Sorangium sp. So ce315]
MTDLVRREAEFLLYQTKDGRTRVEVRFDGDTAWLSLGQMAELFQRDKSVISRHIKNVFDEGELDRSATVAKSATVQREGDRDVEREVEYFNLDVIISVGYRVRSSRTPAASRTTKRPTRSRGSRRDGFAPLARSRKCERQRIRQVARREPGRAR